MVGVCGVLQLDFPIAGKAELVLAACRDRIAAALLHEEVDPRLGRAEEVLQRLDRVVHRGKQEPRVGLDPERDQRVVLFAETRVVAVLHGNTPERAVRVVGPGMVGTHKGFRAAGPGLAHGGRAVAAAVEQHPHHAVAAPHDDHGLLADMGGDEIARLAHLALMRDPDPGPLEDALHLELEQLRVAVERGVDAVVQHQGVDVGLRGSAVQQGCAHVRS